MIDDLEAMEEQFAATMTGGQAKRMHRQLRKAERKVLRATRRRYWRCFWSWPFRHEWHPYERVEDDKIVAYKACVGCKRLFGS